MFEENINRMGGLGFWRQRVELQSKVWNMQVVSIRSILGRGKRVFPVSAVAADFEYEPHNVIILIAV